ncbi:hypothetical protein KAT82_05015 [bacterium]|nr:hypothetical protein [bacterium]
MNPDKTEPEGPRVGVGRYRLNLALLVVLLVLMVVYFRVHLELYVTQGYLVGGTLSLWGLLKLIRARSDWCVKEAGIEPTKALLGRPGGTELLIVGFIVLAFLFGTTSSIYITYKPVVGAASEFEVQVTSGDHLYMEPLAVTSYDRVAGRPYFPRFGAKENLTFRITKPPGYAPLKKTFGAWSNLSVEVPAGFDQRRLLLLLPGPHLKDELPKTDDPAEVAEKYVLRLRYGDRVHTIEDFRVQGTLVGGRAEDMEEIWLRSDVVLLETRLGRHQGMREWPAADKRRLLGRWLGEPRYHGTPEFEAGQTVTVEIVSERGETLLPPQDIEIPEGSVITPVILEESQ